MTITANELLEAAARADAAGDVEGAKTLVREAQRMIGAQPTQAAPTGPTFGGMTADQFPNGQPDSPADAPTPNGLDNSTPPRPNRFGDTTGRATAGPIAAMGRFAAGLSDQSQSPTMRSLPEWMQNTMGGQMVAGVGDLGGVALSALGTAAAGVAGATAEVIAGDQTQERKLSRDLLMGMQVAAPELAGVSSTTRLAGNTARAANRLAETPTPGQASARAADALGITPALGMTGPNAARLAAGLETVPGAGSIIARDSARAATQIESAFQRIRGQIGQALDPASAGEALQTGVRAAVDAFQRRSSELFDKVADRIPATTPVPLTATQRAFDEMRAPFANNPALAAKLGLNEWNAVMSEATQNGINWPAVRQFRSEIGRAIGSNRGALADEDLSRLQRLYGALTEDMGAAAERAGNGAFGAWRAANSYYRRGAQQIEETLDKTVSATSPERAFEAFTAMTRADRASSDVSRMRTIKQALENAGRDEWDTVAASIVERLGRSTPGNQNAAGDAFSPVTFLTEYNRMAPEAKRILLPEGVRTQLDQLAMVSEAARDGLRQQNSSRTATAGAYGAAGAGIIAAPTSTLSFLAGANLSARFMTTEMTLNALNRAARGDTRALEAMARGNGPFMTDAREILRLTAAETAANSPANSQQQPQRAAPY